jgi:hypothetical protein
MGKKIMLTHTEADPVRLAFPFLWAARPGMKNDDGTVGKAKFEASFILNPGGPNAQAVEAAIAEVAEEAWGADWKDFFGEFADDQKGLRKGNLKRNASNEIYDGFEGKLYVTAKNETRPGVYIPGPDGKPVPAVASDGKPYGGCYTHAEIDVWALKKMGMKKRIVIDLCGCMFVRDGDAFGAGSAPSKADSFASLAVPADEGTGSGSSLFD